MVLAVVVVAVAGMAGRAHFSGPRWVPHFKAGSHKPAPARVHAPPASHVPRTQPPRGSGGFPLGTLALWTVVAILVLSAAYLVWRWWAARPSRAARLRSVVALEAASEAPAAPEAEPEADVPRLRTGIELALQLLDEPREPADAVVRAWLGLQETAEGSGIVRQAAETPTEFTARIMRLALADDGAIRTLLRLYLRTRFSRTPVTAEDVDAVRAALRELVRTWPTPTPASASRPGSD